MTIPSYGEGDYVEIWWQDAVVYTNERLSKAVALSAVNLGRVVSVTPHVIVLETGRYIGLDPDTVGDYTVIPIGWVSKVRILAGPENQEGAL